MYNWADLCSELKELEKRVDTKMNCIISVSANPFPYERLKKGKEIMALSMALRMFIDQDLEKDATVVLNMLQEKGLKLKSVR
ncbi:hypothetical protein [Algoriphagus aquimarinus]|uniref:Uncharacterized protein n=1 Tax=Algoriphagus aquimarinus TaxID=237018 RepID=A0A5C7AXG0_9BACT|nr:hypothetical protein [Algoriphagus aquimarinus]TXE13460.1 hypothetical protein ESV85_05665 [Algoriphagus aquimarinus]